MANTPTRPPNRSPIRRRTPKGNRVASDLRARLKQASAQLNADGHPDLAASVDAVLAPGGWSKLRGGAGSPSASNLPLFMTEDLRTALKEAADEKDVALGSLVTEGFRAAIEGRWTPPEPPVRARRHSKAAQRKVNLNVRVDDLVRAELEESLPRLSFKVIGRAGARLSLASIAIAWLREELGVEDDQGAAEVE